MSKLLILVKIIFIHFICYHCCFVFENMSAFLLMKLNLPVVFAMNVSGTLL